MAAIRRVTITHFRGFERFEVVLGRHVGLVGEPGAGRTDLIDGLIRVLDPDHVRTRPGVDLDFHNLDTSVPAEVELIVGGLSPTAIAALNRYVEVWDGDQEEFIPSLASAADFDPAIHERVIRLTYRLAEDADQLNEFVYWPKYSDPSAGTFDRATRSQRELIPLHWQRGGGIKALDLSARGQFRRVIDAQTVGRDFSEIVDDFVEQVEDAAATFSGEDRVAAALTAALATLRDVRRFDPFVPAADLVQFLPEGGAASGLLRSLAAAVTLDTGPALFPAARHGATLNAALRAGLLHAMASSDSDAIVIVDDFAADLDGHLGRHLAAELRAKSAQFIATARTAEVVSAFQPDEIVRMYWHARERAASRGIRVRTRADRIDARHYLESLVSALNASAVVIVEGIGDRIAISTLGDRGRETGVLTSLDGAGLAVIAAPAGKGSIPKVARAAKQFGLFSVAVFDHDGGPPASDADLQAALPEADTVVRLPNRMAIERLILTDVADTELVRIWTELDAALGGLALPPGWETRTGADLVDALLPMLHSRSGVLHGAYLRELDRAHLPPAAIAAVREIRRLSVERTPAGLVELTWP